jgi:hypothetical protein
MALVFEQLPFFARRSLRRHLARHLADPWIGTGCRQTWPAISMLSFIVPPDSAAGLRRLAPRTWAVPFEHDKGFGSIEVGNSWRHRGFSTSKGSRSLLHDRLRKIDAEEGERTVRIVRIPNLHVHALWVTADDGGDRFYVDYNFAKTPLPATMAIEEFLSFIRQLYAAKQAAYERGRKWAIERGMDPADLVG